MLIDKDKLILHLSDWAFGIAPTEMTTDKDEYKERAIVYKTINECIEVIEMLPSAERDKGEWREDDKLEK